MTFSSEETSPRSGETGLYIAPADQQTLLDLANQVDSPSSIRAKILLAASKGLSSPAISAQTGASRWQVYYWKRRYRQFGIQAISGVSKSAEIGKIENVETKIKKSKKKKPKKHRGLSAAEITTVESISSSVTQAEPQKISVQSIDLPLATPRPAMNLLPGDTLAEAGRKVFSFFLARMLFHEPGTRLGEDIEELHDMRVATRRMRAAFDIFGAAYRPQRIKIHLKGLRATGRALGAVRDWDVFLEKADRDIHLLSETDQANLASLLAFWRGERENARGEMMTYLDSEPYRQFVTNFNDFIQTPGKHDEELHDGMFDGVPVPAARTMALLSPVLIYTRLGAVRAFAGTIPHAKIVQLHALRIQFKSLHYILDFLKEILGPEAKTVLASVKQMQDHLGDLNDADVACQRLSALLENWEQNQLSTPLAERQTPESLLAYLSLKHRQRHDLLIGFPAAWQAFDTYEFREQLARAVAIL